MFNWFQSFGERPMRLTRCSLLSLLLATGCGGPDNRGEISGTVRFNGEPLATGSISFVPTGQNSGPTSGALIAGGTYHVPRDKGAAVGENRVMIRSVAKTGRKIVSGHGDLVDERRQIIPAKYNDASELVRTVQPSSNQLDFDLK
jgi:hypothetical protein